MASDTPKLRVAMVVASPFPANHGTPGSIRETAEAIACRGCDVHFVTYHFGDTEADDDSLQVHRIPSLGASREMVVGPTWRKPLLDLAMVFTLRRVVREQNIDVIHGHNYEGALIGWLGSLLTRRPLVYSAINTMADELASYDFIRPRSLARAVARMLDWMVPRLADNIVAISDDVRNFVLAQGVPAKRIRTIPLGIDTKPFDAASPKPVRERYHPSGGLLVMYTGILEKLQRVDYLLRAMVPVREARPDARLLLLVNFATEAQTADWRQLTASLGLGDAVEFVLSDSFDDVPKFLAGADVAVVPRPGCPGFPVKLLNYMASRTPVVVFDGSAKGLRHLEEAYVVPDHDWRGLADGIIRIADDQELAEKLADNAYRHVQQHYAWPGPAVRLIELYEQVHAARLGRRGLPARTEGGRDDAP